MRSTTQIDAITLGTPGLRSPTG